MAGRNSVSLHAGQVSFATAALFLFLVAALLFIRPDLDPSWRMISEYAIGEYGWLMVLAFLSLALSCIALFIALRPHISKIGGYIGLALLPVTAAGLIMAAIFTTDPVTAGEEARTTHGKLHEIGAMLDAIPFAAMLISWNLAKRNAAWASARRSLLWTTILVWAGEAIFIVSLVTMLPTDGKLSPDVKIGWPGRLSIFLQCVWVMTAAWHAVRLQTTNLELKEKK